MSSCYQSNINSGNFTVGFNVKEKYSKSALKNISLQTKGCVYIGCWHKSHEHFL